MTEQKIEKNAIFSTSISREQSKDTGLALILLMLIAGYVTGNILFYKLSILLVLIVMTVPGWFYPLGIIWFGISRIMGTFMSKLLLTVVYFLIVLPVALIRKLAGIDNLKLGQFKKESTTVMKIRNHIYEPSDIEKPF